MQVFCVFREGIYRHECGGVFTTLALAKEAAISLIRQEPDGYHNYEVKAFLLDEVALFHPGEPKEFGSKSYGALIESQDVCGIYREGEQVIVTGEAFADESGTIKAKVLQATTL